MNEFKYYPFFANSENSKMYYGTGNEFGVFIKAFQNGDFGNTVFYYIVDEGVTLYYDKGSDRWIDCVNPFGSGGGGGGNTCGLREFTIYDSSDKITINRYQLYAMMPEDVEDIMYPNTYLVFFTGAFTINSNILANETLINVPLLLLAYKETDVPLGCYNFNSDSCATAVMRFDTLRANQELVYDPNSTNVYTFNFVYRCTGLIPT